MRKVTEFIVQARKLGSLYDKGKLSIQEYTNMYSRLRKQWVIKNE